MGLRIPTAGVPGLVAAVTPTIIQTPVAVESTPGVTVAPSIGPGIVGPILPGTVTTAPSQDKDDSGKGKILGKYIRAHV